MTEMPAVAFKDEVWPRFPVPTRRACSVWTGEPPAGGLSERD